MYVCARACACTRICANKDAYMSCACGGQRASPLGDILQKLFTLFSKTGSLTGTLVFTG